MVERDVGFDMMHNVYKKARSAQFYFPLCVVGRVKRRNANVNYRITAFAMASFSLMRKIN